MKTEPDPCTTDSIWSGRDVELLRQVREELDKIDPAQSHILIDKRTEKKNDKFNRNPIVQLNCVLQKSIVL